MDLFLQQTVNGLGQGAVIALFAIGFGLIFGKLEILNVAHGAFATWGAVVTFYGFTDWGIPIWGAIALGTLAGGIIGVVVDMVAFDPLRGRTLGFFGPLITSIGAWIILLSTAQIAIGANATGFPAEAQPGRLFVLGNIRVLPMVSINLAIVAVVGLGVWALLARTRIGASIRAIGHDPRTIAITGVDTRRVIWVTALLAGAIAGLAGSLAALTTNVVKFDLGEELLVTGFAAVVIGGVGNVWGAVVGGFAIGLIEVLGAQYISNSFRNAIVFGILLLALLIRPQGLFGELEVNRA